MSAYIVVEVDVKDPVRFEEYRSLVMPTLKPYGGRYIVRGGEVQNLEGDWLPARLVVIEFDSAEQAGAWWASEEYAPAKAIRQASADTEMILVEGI
jgi:uncharacterized protein (DUF1330 family)